MAILNPVPRRPGWPNRCRRGLWLLGATLLGLLAPPAAGQPPVSSEYQVKAVFLFNFAQFVEWPERAFAKSDSPLVIGIVGEDPFGAYLDDLVKGEKVGARPLVVRRGQRPEEIPDSHILFISRSVGADLPKVLEQLRGRSVLTVSDVDTFNRLGGIVRLATEAGKIRLKIGVDAARAAGLTISSKILRPSTIVKEGDK